MWFMGGASFAPATSEYTLPSTLLPGWVYQTVNIGGQIYGMVTQGGTPQAPMAATTPATGTAQLQMGWIIALLVLFLVILGAGYLFSRRS